MPKRFPAETPKKLLDIQRKRGLSFSSKDESYFNNLMQDIFYDRFFDPYVLQYVSSNGKLINPRLSFVYQKSTWFEKIMKVFNDEIVFQNSLIDNLIKLEIWLKTRFIFSMQEGPDKLLEVDFYLDINNFESSKGYKKTNKIILETYQKMFPDKKYVDLPAYKLINKMTFGEFAAITRSLNINIKDKLYKIFGFSSWDFYTAYSYMIIEARNWCAHHQTLLRKYIISHTIIENLEKCYTFDKSNINEWGYWKISKNLAPSLEEKDLRHHFFYKTNFVAIIQYIKKKYAQPNKTEYFCPMFMIIYLTTEFLLKANAVETSYFALRLLQKKDDEEKRKIWNKDEYNMSFIGLLNFIGYK